VRRLAILPANILIADPASEWLRIAIPFGLQQDLAGSRDTAAFLALNESAVLETGANEVLRVTAENYRDRLQLTATFTDLAQQRTTKVIAVQAPASNPVISLLNTLAKRIDPAADSFAPVADRTFQLFSQAIQTEDASTRISLLRQVITADPHFGLAYVALLNTVAPSGAQGAGVILQEAGANAPYFTSLDRARIQAWRLHYAHAPLAELTRAGEAVLALTPNDVEQLSAVAADLYLAGKGKQADQFMQRALTLSPENTTARQRYARGLIETRRFREAEQVLTEIKNSPSALIDLAFCVLLQGDRARADIVAQKFLDSTPSSDIRTLLNASWHAMADDIPSAVQIVRNAAFNDSRVRSLAFSQAALWQVSVGNLADAQELAKMGQAGNSFTLFAGLLIKRPGSAEAFRSEVNAIEPAAADQQAKDMLTAFGYFLFNFHLEAVEAWQGIVHASGNSDLPSRAMLAASLIRAGRAADAPRAGVQPVVADFKNF
jgi:hypothetical protein